MLNQHNTVESLIRGAGNLTKVKGGIQGFVKGDGAAIFKSISHGGDKAEQRYYNNAIWYYFI